MGLCLSNPISPGTRPCSEIPHEAAMLTALLTAVPSAAQLALLANISPQSASFHLAS